MRHLTSCILTIYTGMWNWYEYLPIHLCDISVVLCAVTLITKSQLLFEYTLYLGMPGAITAIATPVFIHGSENLFVVDYYIAHLGILFCAMYSIFILKMQPRKLSWLKIYLLGIIVIFIPVTVVNLFLDTNYIYTMAPPYIGHPLTFGPWPYYLIGYHFTAIVSNLVIYYSFNIKKSKSKIENLEMSK